MRSTLVLTSVFGISFARLHSYCACQTQTDRALSDGATWKVLAASNGAYAKAQDDQWQWVSYNPQYLGGPTYPGPYLIDSNHIGIDGDTFKQQCVNAGAGDSACFQCNVINRRLSEKQLYCTLA